MTDQSMSVTVLLGDEQREAGWGAYAGQDAAQRMVLPVVASRSELVTNASERIPGWGNSTRTTRLNPLALKLLPSDWKTLLSALKIVATTGTWRSTQSIAREIRDRDEQAEE